MAVKFSILKKLKYRFLLIGAYILFIILSVITARLADSSMFGNDGITYNTASYIPKKGSDTGTVHEYKKGDLISLKVYFKKEYLGHEVNITFCNLISGLTTEIYKGDALKVLCMTYQVEADGPAEFLVNLVSDNKNITDDVIVYAAVRHNQ
ncbi:MAG: hypothetical protein ACFWTJ_12180 [Lachnoclostridium sp.]|jgi:hypothetical protein